MHSDPDAQRILIDGYHQSISESDKKATHSEIEKRRRQKMNKYLGELLHYLPVGSSKSKKIDKISILKTAVNHMKNLKASSSILSDSFICQNYISASELQSIILKDSDDFLIVIKCDSGKILYISESCQKSIGITSSDLTDKVFFELVHPSDTKQVKDQLVYADKGTSNPSGHSLVFNQYRNLNTGVRRSFHCRIKLGSSAATYAENENREAPIEIKQPEYKVINFNGYLRSDALKNLSRSSAFSSNDSSKLTPSRGHASASKTAMSDGSGQLTQYLIAYGHAKHRATHLVNFEFISRLDIDGKFIYVEPGVNLLLGYLPHQLMSESIFNHVHPDDVHMLRKTFQDALNNPQQKVLAQTYRLKLENNVKVNSYTNVETVFYALSNPSSCQLEYVLAQTRLASISDISSTALGILSVNRANSSSISLPMTPSPEEIAYSNSDTMSEKGNSSAFLSSSSTEYFGMENSSMDQMSKTYYNYLASPTKANPIANNLQLQNNVLMPNQTNVAAAYKSTNRAQQMNQQLEAGNYNNNNNVIDSQMNQAPTNEYYTGGGQHQSSQFNPMHSANNSSISNNNGNIHKAEFVQPTNKHASFNNTTNYEYVQHEHAYAGMNSNQQQQPQYAGYDNQLSQMQHQQSYPQQKGTSFPLQQEQSYMPYNDNPYGDSSTSNTMNK